MSSTTPRLNLYMPADDGSEVVNVATDLNDNLEKIDASIGAVPATSSTPPDSPFDGMIRQNTDTQTVQYYRNNSIWTQLWAAGSTFASNAILALGNKIGIGVTSPGAVIDAITTNVSDLLLRFKINGESTSRVELTPTSLKFGSGSATHDTQIYRTGAASLGVKGTTTFENNMVVTGTSTLGNNVNVTGTLAVDGPAQLTEGATIEGASTLDGFPMMSGYAGIATATVTNATSNASNLTTVTFPQAFSTRPAVVCNLLNGAGVTSGFHVRAINITTTSFQIFVLGGSSNVTFTTDIPWIAVKI